MHQRFNSKVSYLLFGSLLCLFIVLLVISIINRQWLSLAIIIPVTGFIINLLTQTYYEIDGDKLKIVSGIFYRKEIDIPTIRKVEKTRSPISSPALSVLHRVEISFNKFDSVIISPERQSEFIEALKLINKNISTNL